MADITFILFLTVGRKHCVIKILLSGFHLGDGGVWQFEVHLRTFAILRIVGQSHKHFERAQNAIDKC